MGKSWFVKEDWLTEKVYIPYIPCLKLYIPFLIPCDIPNPTNNYVCHKSFNRINQQNNGSNGF